MIKVAGIWELGWNTPIKEMDLWEMVTREFNVEQFYMCPVSGIFTPFVTERVNIQDVINENPDYTVVWVDEHGSEDLIPFVHPENALYIFGKTNERPMASWGKPEDKVLKITTPGNTALLWSHQVLSIVLYDRMIKSV